MNNVSYIIIIVFLCLLLLSIIGLLIYKCVKNSASPYSGPENYHRIVVFDDGPWTSKENPINKNSPIEDRSFRFHLRIAQALQSLPKQTRTKYIFALNGIHAYKYKDIIKELPKTGAIIANHSFSHIKYGESSLEDCITEWKKAQDILTNIFGEPPTIFQYPHLSENTAFTEFLENNNIEILSIENQKKPIAPCDDYNPQITYDELLNSIKKQLSNNKKVFTLHSCENTSRYIYDILNIIESNSLQPAYKNLLELRNNTLWQLFEDRIYLQEYCKEYDLPCVHARYSSLGPKNETIKELENIIKELDSFVVKMNHFSSGKGVLIVINGKIDKKFDHSRVNINQISQIPQGVNDLWDIDINDCPGEMNVRRGVIIEDILPDGFEIKIHCWFAQPFYAHIVKVGTNPFKYEPIVTCSIDTLNNMNNFPKWITSDAIHLAKKFAQHTGIDYIRVDIRHVNNHCLITEVTRCGGDLNKEGKNLLLNKFKQLPLNLPPESSIENYPTEQINNQGKPINSAELEKYHSQ